VLVNKYFSSHSFKKSDRCQIIISANDKQTAKYSVIVLVHEFAGQWLNFKFGIDLTGLVFLKEMWIIFSGF
jgi:hypothetical protein